MSRTTPEEQLEVFRDRAEALVSEAELLAKLRKGRPLRIKYGCDPSRPDLHLGHLVHLDKLRALQALGHTIIFLIGDFTGRIGDPTGRSRTRPALSREEIEQNADTYRQQVGRVLDVERAEIRFNSEWMDRMDLGEFIRLCSHATVARLLERDDFRSRLRDGVSIALHELLYPLVQAYDSVALEADVEVGGSDQHVNLLFAREIQRDFGHEPQVALTSPLLEGTDGVEKMSKSLGNAIGLTDPPDEMYGRTMSIPDAVLLRWCRLLGRPDWADLWGLADRVEAGEGNPRDLKAVLARRLAERFWGADAAGEAEARFDRLFRRHETPEEMAQIEVCAPGPEGAPVLDLLLHAEFAASRGEAKRLIAQGGVRLGGARVGSAEARAEPGEHVLQAGKRRFVRVCVRLPSV
jgi:tyrosyl-tRNA synthetase